MMDKFLDEKEKKYIAYFDEPSKVAHDVYPNPHVDVYIFNRAKRQEHIYLTKGLEEAGFRELMMITQKQEKWPVYFLQAVCNYLIIEKEKIKEMDTYDNAGDILETNGFNHALFLDISLLEFDRGEVGNLLGLNNPPLYVFPITKAELEFAINNNTVSLLEKVVAKVSPVASVTRESTV